MIKYVIKISLMIMFVLFLTGCQATNNPEQIDLEYRLKSQIDISNDDYLYLFDDYLDMLRLDSLHYGSFTKDTPEVAAVFKVLNTPHAAGLDRTIVAIYDADSLEIISSETFAADIVSVYFLHGRSTEYLFIIQNVTYQGYTVYTAGLYSIEDGAWSAKTMPVENTDGNLVYAVTNNDRLHIFELSYTEQVIPVYEYKYTFIWDKYIESFVSY